MIRWIAAAGAGVISLDSIINVAFPAMAAAFAEPPERVRWVIVCYVFTYSLTAFGGGALADRVGHARVFRAGLALTAVALALGGVASTFDRLLAARVLQGLGGGLVYGTAPGIVTLAATPEARGRALGFLNAGIGVGFTVGPLVAGPLVAQLGWRSTFYVRVPVALLVLGWALVGLPAARGGGARLVAAADVLRRAVLGPGMLSFVANAAIFSVWLLAPFYLVLVRGLDATTAGLSFTLTPLGTALAAPVAGVAADRLGTRGPMSIGLALEALGLFLLSRCDAGTPMPIIAGALFAAGFGVGLFQVPNMALIMGAFAGTQQGVAGGFAFLARTLGVVSGVLVLAGLFAARRESVGLQPAFAEAFLAAAAAVALAAVASAIGRARRLLVALAALSVAAAACAPVVPAVDSREAYSRSAGYPLVGTLTRPSTGTPAAGVLIIPGSGPIDRDGSSKFAPGPAVYRQWEERLSAAGFAVLRYDKRFVTHRAVDIAAFDEDAHIADARAALAWLRAAPRLASKPMFIVGHSEGGTLAPLVAAGAGAVDGVAIVNAAQFAVDELVVAQLEARSDVPPGTIPVVKRLFAQVEAGSFPQGGLLLGAGGSYWAQWIRYSRQSPTTLSRLSSPLLLIQCMNDEALPGDTLARTVALLRDVAAAKGNARLHELAGHDHFGALAGQRESSPAFIQAIVDWLRYTARR